MNLAEHFEIPVITLIDTVGAYPSFESEQTGQSEALATNLLTMVRASHTFILWKSLIHTIPGWFACSYCLRCSRWGRIRWCSCYWHGWSYCHVKQLLLYCHFSGRCCFYFGKVCNKVTKTLPGSANFFLYVDTRMRTTRLNNSLLTAEILLTCKRSTLLTWRNVALLTASFGNT